MNELQTLIAMLETRAQELRAHAAKDLASVEARAAKVKGKVEAELARLLDELHQLPGGGQAPPPPPAQQ